MSDDKPTESEEQPRGRRPKRNRAEYQREYYRANKGRLNAMHTMSIERAARLCKSCHLPFTPAYARQRLCKMCMDALNEKARPKDATPEQQRIFDGLAQLTNKQRRLISAGFAKKRTLVETMLRSAITVCTQEIEACTWRESYYELSLRVARGQNREEVEKNLEMAHKMRIAANEKLLRAQHNLDVHNTIQNDGKYFDPITSKVVHTGFIPPVKPTDEAEPTPEENYRRLLDELDAGGLLD